VKPYFNNFAKIRWKLQFIQSNLLSDAKKKVKNRSPPYPVWFQKNSPAYAKHTAFATGELNEEGR
jgi:hypothetical protein